MVGSNLVLGNASMPMLAVVTLTQVTLSSNDFRPEGHGQSVDNADLDGPMIKLGYSFIFSIKDLYAYKNSFTFDPIDYCLKADFKLYGCHELLVFKLCFPAPYFYLVDITCLV